MPNEYESMARALMGSPQGAKIFQTLDKLSADKDPARVLVSNLLGTKEGAALVAKTIEVIGV